MGRDVGGNGCMYMCACTYPLQYSWASLVAQLIKNPPAMAGDLGSIPELGRSSGEGKGYPIQYSGLENSMDCITHGVAKSRTWLSDFPSHIHIHVYEATWSSLVAQMVENLPTLWETWVQSLGKEDPLEEEMANHSSILPRESMDRGAWWVIVHWVAKSWAWLSN